jgi:uncharacterized membrane protein YgcG
MNKYLVALGLALIAVSLVLPYIPASTLCISLTGSCVTTPIAVLDIIDPTTGQYMTSDTISIGQPINLVVIAPQSVTPVAAQVYINGNPGQTYQWPSGMGKMTINLGTASSPVTEDIFVSIQTTGGNTVPTNHVTLTITQSSSSSSSSSSSGTSSGSSGGSNGSSSGGGSSSSSSGSSSSSSNSSSSQTKTLTNISIFTIAGFAVLVVGLLLPSRGRVR